MLVLTIPSTKNPASLYLKMPRVPMDAQVYSTSLKAKMELGQKQERRQLESNISLDLLQNVF